ncbi:MAG: hypothetical protein ACYCV7_14050 [Acidimicrobiales bacterium]
MPILPPRSIANRMMVGTYDTGMDLLAESARALDMAGQACDAAEDAAYFSALADRIRSYLAVSRSTTTLGMPRIPPDSNRLADESVIHRTHTTQQSHIRVLPA